MRRIVVIIVLLFAIAVNVVAQTLISVDCEPVKTVSPELYGIFFEDINHAADGGLYAELISNRSFEDEEAINNSEFRIHNSELHIPSWIVEGAQASLTKKGLLNAAQGHALEVIINNAADGHKGRPLQAQPAILVYSGFWGYQCRAGQTLQALALGKRLVQRHYHSTAREPRRQDRLCRNTIDGRGFRRGVPPCTP